MPVKKGGKSIVLDAEILSSVDKWQKVEGFRGSLTSYIETILLKYSRGEYTILRDNVLRDMALELARLTDEVRRLNRSDSTGPLGGFEVRDHPKKGKP